MATVDDYVDLERFEEPTDTINGHPVVARYSGWATTYSCLECSLTHVPHVELRETPCRSRYDSTNEGGDDGR